MKSSLILFFARLGGVAAAFLLTINARASSTVFADIPQATAVPCTPMPSGVVGWWRAEGNPNDSADSNNGTIAGTGTVSYGPGLVGQAFVFDGTHRDRVDLGNPTDLQLQDFTIEAWVKRSSPTITSFDVLGADGSVAGDGAVILGYGRGGYGFALANDGRMIISRIDLDGIYSAPLVTDTNWHHLAVTKSGSNAVFYVDGVPQATPPYDHPAPYTFDDATCTCSAAIAIGSRGDARGGTFFGTIDEVAIYNRPLSAAEIQAIFAASSAGKCVPCTPTPSGVVGWWRAEGNANDTADSNDGTIAGTGTVSYGPGLVGQAFVFDGTHRDRVNLGNPTNLQLQDFTIEAWVKRSSPTVTSFDILGADGSVTGDSGFILGYGRGGYCFVIANDGRLGLSRVDLDGLFSAPLVTDTNWHHLAVTKSGSNAVFYVDGAPQATPPYDHPAPYTFDDATCTCSAAIAIGSRGDARGGTFFGTIDEVAIYNRPLSAAEIHAIYAASTAGKCPILPTPVIEVSPLAQFPGETNLIVIAPNGLSANVTFDGSNSYGVNGTNLLYFWYEGATLLATSAVTTQVLAVGTHVVTLVVADPFLPGTNSASVTVEVITPSQAVGIVMGLLDNALPRNSRQPLMASLVAAGGSFDRGQDRAGINQLMAFENKVRAKVALSNPVLANELISAAQSIINALGTL